MVPLGGFNYADLQWSSGLSLRMRNTQIATAQTVPGPGRTRVRVDGLQVGETALEVVEPGRSAPVARLDISVLPKKTVRIGFHFLTDNQGHVTNRMGETSQGFVLPMRGPARVRRRPRNAQSMAQCVQECLTELDNIYTPQTNVGFALQNLGLAVINRNLGAHVQASFDLKRRLRLLRDLSARINVFFIWDIVVPREHAVGLAMAPLSDNICLVDDETPLVGQTVAHEVGHILLRPLRFHHFTSAASRHMLMHEDESPDSRTIPKQQAIHMNRQA